MGFLLVDLAEALPSNQGVTRHLNIYEKEIYFVNLYGFPDGLISNLLGGKSGGDY